MRLLSRNQQNHRIGQLPLPNIEASLASLAKQTLFSVIDSKEAYFSIPMDKDSIPKTAFCTQFGLYEYLRMPYGLSNACSCFARAIHEALSHLSPEVCLPYMDDCLMIGISFEEQLVY